MLAIARFSTIIGELLPVSNITRLVCWWNTCKLGSRTELFYTTDFAAIFYDSSDFPKQYVSLTIKTDPNIRIISYIRFVAVFRHPSEKAKHDKQFYDLTSILVYSNLHKNSSKFRHRFTLQIHLHYSNFYN